MNGRYLYTVAVSFFVFLVWFCFWFLPRRQKIQMPVAAVAQRRVAAVKRAPQLIRIESELALQRSPVLSDGRGNDVVMASFKVTRGCLIGDMDAILLELAHSGIPKLILTLEAVPGQAIGFKPLVYEVTPAQLNYGFLHEFRFPHSDVARTLGFYLCKDSTDSGSCAGKPVKTVNEILSSYVLPKKPDFSAPDSTYFFQVLHFDTDGYMEAFSNGIPKKETANLLERYLGLQMGGPSAQRTAAESLRLTKTVMSEPLALGNIVTLNAPKFDRQICQASRAQKGK